MRARVGGWRRPGLGCALLSLALVGCSSDSERLEPGPTLAQCEKPKDEGRRQRPQGDYDRDQCYRHEAIDRDQPALCLRLAKPSAQARCVAAFAEQKDELKWCQRAQLIYPQPTCFMDLAVRLKSVGPCQELREVEVHDACVNQVASANKQPEQCDTIRGAEAHDACVAGIAAALKDPRLCERSRNAWRARDCRKSSTTDPACLPARDAAKTAAPGQRAAECAHPRCDQLPDAGQRDDCLVDLVAARGSGDLCASVVGRKADCYLAAALRGTPAYCEEIDPNPDSLARRFCFKQALARGPQSCAGITETEQAEQCNLLRGAEKRDRAACAALTHGEVADDCWFQLSPRDASACLEIKQPDYRRACSRKAWPGAVEEGVCAQVGSADVRRACSAQVAKNRARKLEKP